MHFTSRFLAGLRHLGSLTVAAVLLGSGAASAQAFFDAPPPAEGQPDNRDFIGTIMLGAGASPAYFGSDKYEIGPAFDARIDFLRLPGGLEFGSTRSVGYQEGFGFAGSARYIPKRDSSDYSELRGLDTVDMALELGGGLSYGQKNWRAFGTVRYAVLGYNSWTGTIGADAIARPSDSLILNMGPRIEFSSKRFMTTYYGVTGDEAANSNLSAYDPSGGLTSVGIELGANYAFSDRWGIEGVASYDRLVGDAADSPITGTGSADQYGVRVGITRQISLDF